MTHTAYRQHPKYREGIFDRDNYTCQLCGATERLELDHIITYAISHDSEEDNMRVLCTHCNRLTRQGRRALPEDEYYQWVRDEIAKG